tara:strand:- start:4920 stop:5132 length:213 start_codon:yes stop_codon:yes gene_type:complete
MSKHKRVIQHAVAIIGDDIMTTREIYDVYQGKHFKACPTIQGLSMVLKRNKEFTRINKYDYPAEWMVSNE